MTNYYYLISSLPELEYKHGLPLPDCKTIVEFISKNLSEKDLALFQFLRYPEDIKLLVNNLFEKKNLNRPYPFVWENTTFSTKDIPDLINGKIASPAFIRSFFDEYLNTSEAMSPSESEKKLWGLFYTAVSELEESFLKSWFHFDLQLKRAINVSNGRKFNLSTSEKENEMNVPIQNGFSDFNVLKEKEFLHHENTPVELEVVLDKIKWKYLDQLSSFSFFTVHTVFSWFLKYQILLRWSGNLSDEQLNIRIKELITESIKDIQQEISPIMTL
jgi:hypothetical protein